MSPRKFLTTAAAIAALGAVSVAPAQAATDDTQIELTAGALDFGTTFSAANFPTTQLNGLAQTVSTSVSNWSVNDATGSLLGWNVKISASRFTDNNGTAGDTSDDKQLPTSLLTLTAPTVSAGASQADLLKPVVQPVTTALDAVAAVPVAIAAVTTGQGLWNFTQGNSHLTLVVPPTAQAGTYKSTITTTLSSGVL